VQDREAFVRERSAFWHELERLLGSRARFSELRGPEISRAAALYRSLCADLMHARRIGCTPDVVGFLDTLTARTHSALYSARSRALATVRELLLWRFPRAFRASWPFMLAAALLFVLPLLVGLLGALASNQFAQRVLPTHQLESLAQAYAEGFSGRAAQADAEMAGFYIDHNIGIAFQCFATGILGGLGSVYFLIYNGLAIGTVFGYVTHAGAGDNILTFVCGHAPFELTAIVIAGGAGLRLGFALIATDGLTRVGSLRRHALELVALVAGISAMLTIAALIEGFWSPSSLPAQAKHVVAVAGALAMFGFLLFGGRARRPA
jgi:uncharacterized membrane protein SpoIIM required for sporulation